MIFNCSDDLVYTYEALSLVSRYPFCTDKLKEQFSKNQSCGGDTDCVNKIVCEEARQKYCTAEWRALELKNETKGLIDCTEYNETASLECDDQFGLTKNGATCVPLCVKFSQFNKAYTTIFPIWYSVCSGINVIGGIIALIVFLYKIKKL